MAKDDFDLPPLIVESTDEEAFAGAFGSPDYDPDPTTPLGAAYLWWHALDDPDKYRTDLHNLSVHPSAWNGYRDVASAFEGRSMLSKVENNPDDPDIKYVRFTRYAGETGGRTFAGGLDDLLVMTLVKPEGSSRWMVWGLGENYFPTRDQVRSA